MALTRLLLSKPDILLLDEPSTGLEGKFSLRGTTAMALLGIDTSNPDTFVDDVVNRDDVQALLRQVTVETDASLTTMQTRITCVDGQQNRHEAYHDTNVPDRDLDRQQDKLAQKFVSLTGDADRGGRILDLAGAPQIAV